MANSYTTTTQNTVWIPQIVAQESLGALGNYLQLGRTVAKDSDLTTSQVGQVISTPKRGSLSTNQKTQGSSVTVQRPSGTSVSVTLDQHWEVTFGEEDFTKSLQIGSVVPGYIDDAVIALAEKIETKLAQLHPSFTSTITRASSTTALSDIAKIRERLVNQKVPLLAKKFGYFHPSVITDLLNISAFTNPQLSENNKPLTDGAIGRIYNIEFFEGQLTQATGSPVAYHSLVYTRNAMVLASRPLPQIDPNLGVQSASVIDDNGIALRVLRSYNATELGTQITLDVLFGVAMLDDRLGVEYESF